MATSAAVHFPVRETFPRVDAYIESLPRGLDSYPQYTAKAALLRFNLEARSCSFGRPAALPARVHELLSAPPLPNSWMAESEYVVANLALADFHRLTDEEFCAFWHAVMMKINNSALYARLLRFLDADTLLRTSTMRWNAFHRGILIEANAPLGRFEVTLRFPPGLLPPLILRAYAHVFQALVDVSKRPEARVVLASHDTTRASYQFADFVR